MKNKQLIKNQIKYESAPGEHTFSMCKCGRQGCRGSKCLKCWEEELEKLE